MTKSGKRQESKEPQFWCECECSNYEIGAHERCQSTKCHMPKWKDVKGKATRAWPLGQVLLSKLAELELEFLGRVDSLLHEQSIHRIDRCAKTILA